MNQQAIGGHYFEHAAEFVIYRKNSNIRHTESKNLNDSRLVLRLS